jgi:acetyl-CoA decarbonylase/synthase complex subunit beta
MSTPYHYVNLLTGTRACKVIEEPERLVDIMKEAQRPLFIFGPKAIEVSLNGKPVINYGVAIAQALNNCATVATAHTKRMLLKLRVTPDSCYDVIEIINHLKDPNWQGVRKEGNHDLVIFLGIRTDLANQALSTLKHFAPHLKTLTLCKYLYPNASYSLPNLRDKRWAQLLEGVVNILGGVIPEAVEIEELVEEEVKIGFSVDIGPQYEGESVRKEEYYIEFGGPKNRFKGELLLLKPEEEIKDEVVQIIGKDIKDFEEGSTTPLFIKIYVAGAVLEKDMEPVFERRIHMYCNYIEGFWHISQRADIWLRLHKNSFKKGLNSLDEIGRILIMLFKNELPIIEKIQITFITEPEVVEKEVEEAKKIYQARDERVKGITEEEVDEFYGCTLCQSFAPTHVCIITPERVSLCGAINWFDGRAAYKLDPEGPNFAVKKGELLDKERFVYSGVNEIVEQKSLGKVTEFCLHSVLDHPHTSCGCFQAICFYIPEVDGFGIVHRDFVGETVVGLKFSTMAGEASGGQQKEGYLGVAISYMRSPKFLKTDGGLKRIVWLPKEVKEQVKDVLEEKGLYDKIATEEDVKNVDELREFLNKVGHPWIKGL